MSEPRQSPARLRPGRYKRWLGAMILGKARMSYTLLSMTYVFDVIPRHQIRKIPNDSACFHAQQRVEIA